MPRPPALVRERGFVPERDHRPVQLRRMRQCCKLRTRGRLTPVPRRGRVLRRRKVHQVPRQAVALRRQVRQHQDGRPELWRVRHRRKYALVECSRQFECTAGITTCKNGVCLGKNGCKEGHIKCKGVSGM